MKLKSFLTSQKISSAYILKLTIIFIALSPIFLLIPLLIQNAVNLPLMDQWGVPVNALLKVADGTLAFQDLIAQANESRPLFPRLLFVGMALITGWDIRYEYFVIFLVACLIAYQIYRLSQIAIRGSEYKLLLLSLLANLLIFSPVQSDNWLWGIQLITFIPIACIATGLVVSYSNFEIRLKTLILMLLCTISTYSYANGMLSWLIVFPSAILISRLGKNQKLNALKWLILGGTIGFLANLLLYFYNYVKPPQTPSFSEALAHPFAAVKFFLIFLGTPLGAHNLVTARTVGLVLIILFGCVLLYLLRYRKDRELLYCSIPWIAIGFYSCASGLVTTAGRLGFGLEGAMPSRYTTFSLYLIVSLVYLLAIVADHLIQNHYVKKSKKVQTFSKILLFLLVALLATNFFVLHDRTYSFYAKTMALEHRKRLHAKASLLFVNFIDERPVIETVVFPSYEYVKPKTNQLNAIHLLKPALVESPNILLLAAKEENHTPEAYGYLDLITQNSKAEISVAGWAIFPDRRQPADAVVLAYETPNTEPKAFAIAPVIDKSPDVAKVLGNQAYRNVRWNKTIAIDKLPKGPVKLSAWAFDTETKQAFRLAGSKSLSSPLQ